MALMIETTTTSFSTGAQVDFEIVESFIEADADGGEQFFYLTDMETGSDALALVTLEPGAGEVIADGFEPDDLLSQGAVRGWSYMAEQQFGTVGLTLALRPEAKARVLFARIRRGVFRTLRSVTCRACKAAVKSLISAALATAGIPIPVIGWDLSGAKASVEGAIDAMAQGQINSALQAIAAMLPNSVWDVLKQVLHAANWIWEGMDKITQAVCEALLLCPKQP
jgi:hypothetical protein